MNKIITDPITGTVMYFVAAMLAIAGIAGKPITIKPMPFPVALIFLTGLMLIILIDIVNWIRRYKKHKKECYNAKS